jgi:hypothetical protein
MGIFATIGAVATLVIEVLRLIVDIRKSKTIKEGVKLEKRKEELPKLVDAISKRDSTAYLISLSRMRKARK